MHKVENNSVSGIHGSKHLASGVPPVPISHYKGLTYKLQDCPMKIHGALPELLCQ